MKYKIVIIPRKNVQSVNIVCTHNNTYQGSKSFTTIPSPEWCCIEKQITDKMHLHYVSGKTTKCRCKVGSKINHELRRAKALIDKKNSEIAEDYHGYAVAKRLREKKEKMMNSKDSFFELTLYEATNVAIKSRHGANAENLRSMNNAVSKRFSNWKKIKLRELFTQDFQDKWVLMGREWVIEGQRGFKKMEGSSFERFTRNMKTVGNHFRKKYPEKTRGIRIPLTTYDELLYEIQKTKHKEDINIRPLMDWELQLLEDNIITVRKDKKNNFENDLSHKNPAYNQCCNAFLYACRSGLRYIDIQNLKWNNIIYDNLTAMEDDNYDHTLEVKPSKTKNSTGIVVKLHFNNNESRFLGKRGEPNDLVFPLLSSFANSDMRKFWYKGIGKDKFKDEKYFKFHSARDTLAYNLYNKGCSDMVVAKALGDTVQTVQKHYASMCQEIIAKSTMGVAV